MWQEDYCAQAWRKASKLTILAPLAPAFELLSMISSGDTTVTPQSIRDAVADYEDVADAFDNLETPAEAQAASDQLSTGIRELSALLATIADDLEAGNAEAVTAGITSHSEKAFSLVGGAYGELETRCPALKEL